MEEVPTTDKDEIDVEADEKTLISARASCSRVDPFEIKVNAAGCRYFSRAA